MSPSSADGNAFGRLLRDLETRGKDVRGDADMRLLGQVLAEGLRQAAGRQRAHRTGASDHENGPEIVDVGEGGPRHQQIAARRKDGP